jgi:uncharacterized protein (TIGR01777 family)
MTKNILITGATGLLGKKLVPALLAKGHKISILSRKKTEIKNTKVFLWDVYQQTIDLNAFEGIDTVIHLAGEGIADKKWTDKRKKEIIDSRVLSGQLLYKAIQETGSKVNTFVSASAVGFYGNRADELLTETSAPGNDFLADCCLAWENTADMGLALKIRVVKIRIGLILTKDGGALPQMEKPIKLFVGAALGNGKQWMPWIHLNDMVAIFCSAAEDENFSGAYNACAPNLVNNTQFTQILAKILKRPVWPFNVPVFVLKFILGEMSILPLMSNKTSSKKLTDTGFIFNYPTLQKALTEIYENPTTH